MGHIYVMSQLAERSNGIAVGLADGLKEGKNASREREIFRCRCHCEQLVRWRYEMKKWRRGAAPHPRSKYGSFHSCA